MGTPPGRVRLIGISLPVLPLFDYIGGEKENREGVCGASWAPVGLGVSGQDARRTREFRGQAIRLARPLFPETDRCRPGEAVRGPSSSSTALDPEPTAQTDPNRSFGRMRPTPKRPALAMLTQFDRLIS